VDRSVPCNGGSGFLRLLLGSARPLDMEVNLLTKQWYCEETSFDGHFKPCIYHGEKPSATKAEGGKKRIRNIHEIEPENLGLTLHQLHLLFKDASNENEHR
jgi:hypothetical protein